ncbi:MAG TPA: hypothetical protein PKI11_09315 [Candidatus Hydrogenedentes bacterium]|nr:hypothetical protein [Candidatus Hydrogenedentota bacterium]
MRRILTLSTVALLLSSAGIGGELAAGGAKAVITPALDPPLIGVMGEALEGVETDIYARVLTLYDGATRLVIVTYDLNCLDVATPILRARCRDELGIDPACLILLATHNHAAPIQIVPGNFAYGRRLAEIIFGLIQEAIASESGPAWLRFGFGHGYFLVSVGNAPTDYEVQVLEVRRNDAPFAVLFNHPTHIVQISKTKIDAGHAGFAVDALERRMPGVMAMYADACGGNQFTRKGMFRPRDEVEALGNELANVVSAVLDKPLEDVTGPLRATLDVIPLPLDKPLPYEEAKKLALHFPTGIGLVPYPHPHRESNWVRSLLRYYEEGLSFPTKTTDMVCTDDAFLVPELDEARAFPCRYEETIVATIGPLVFVAMQGEVCAPIGARIKDTFRHERPIMVFGYMGEHNLYIPTREIVRLKVYQAKVLQIQYASPVPWSPNVEDAMVTAVRGMVRRVIASP